jgi:hypothetical protein
MREINSSNSKSNPKQFLSSIAVMATSAVIFLFFASTTTLPPTASIQQAYREALKTENQINKLILLSKPHVSNPLAKAYLATGYALEARASWSPATKMSKAQEAYSLLNQAVKAEPNNEEIRFLRLSFSHGTPDFLNMKSYMADDKKIFLKGEIKKHPISDIMWSFINHSNLFSAAEKATIK